MQPAAKKQKLKENLATLAFFALCALCLFGWRVWQGYVLAPEDDFVQNYPAFASGGTLWTPLLLSGFPILADPQVQFFYPLAWLAKHLPAGAELTANFNLYIASAYVLAAYFAALLGRKLTGSFFAGLIGGLAYGFSGYFISELKHVQVLHTALWLPLILYLLEMAVTSHPDRRRNLVVLFALSIVVALTIFAGHPQTALYVLATAVAYLLLLVFAPSWATLAFPFLRLSSSPSPSSTDKGRLFALWMVLLSFAAGILISAVQLAPSMELSSFSARTIFTLRDFVVGQVEPLQAVGFVIPYIMGGWYGTIGTMPFAEQGPPPGLLFFGFAPLVLASFAVYKEKGQSRVWFFVVLTVLAFIVSMGSHTPLARLVYLVPFFGNFRGLYRVLVLFTLGISMLSAFGMARLEKEYCGNTPEIQGLDLGKMGPSKHVFFCLFIILSCFSYPFLLGSLPLLFFFIKIRRLPLLYKQESTVRQKILVMTVFAVLASYAVNAEWTKALPLCGDLKPPAIANVYGRETAKSHTRIFTVKGLEGDREQLPPNLSRLWGVASATGYEPLVSLRYSRLLGISEGGFIKPPWHISGASRAFDITSVKYLFAPWGEFSERAFDEESKQNWQLTQAAEKTHIYQNKRVLPRFYIAAAAHELLPEAIYNSIVSGKLPDGTVFEPTRIVLIEGVAPSPSPLASGTLLPPTSDQSTNQKTDYQINDCLLGDEQLVFKVKLAKSGYFVLADLFYPGWQATVDGQKAEILQANYVQRALHLGSGEHTITFSYRPESLALGRNVTLATLLAWLVILLSAFVFGQSKP